MPVLSLCTSSVKGSLVKAGWHRVHMLRSLKIPCLAIYGENSWEPPGKVNHALKKGSTQNDNLTRELKAANK